MDTQTLFERLEKSYETEEGFKDVCEMRLPNKKDSMAKILEQGEVNWDLHRESVIATAIELSE